MDCGKFNQNLEKLRALCDEMRSKVDIAVESGTSKQGIVSVQQELSSLSDSILEEYLSDFEEEFPNLFGWELGEEIEGFNSFISSIVPLSDNQFMAGGGDGKLRILTNTPLTLQGLQQAISANKIFNS